MIQVTGGICYAHGPYEGNQCPRFPACVNIPHQEKYVRMAEDSMRVRNKVYTQEEMDNAIANFRTQAMELCERWVLRLEQDMVGRGDSLRDDDYLKGKRDSVIELKEELSKL